MNGAVEAKNYPANPAIAILGVPFDNITPAEASILIGHMLASRLPHYLVKADIDFADGAFSVTGTDRRVGLLDVAARARKASQV